MRLALSFYFSRGRKEFFGMTRGERQTKGMAIVRTNLIVNNLLIFFILGFLVSASPAGRHDGDGDLVERVGVLNG